MFKVNNAGVKYLDVREFYINFVSGAIALKNFVESEQAWGKILTHMRQYLNMCVFNIKSKMAEASLFSYIV